MVAAVRHVGVSVGSQAHCLGRSSVVQQRLPHLVYITSLLCQVEVQRAVDLNPAAVPAGQPAARCRGLGGRCRFVRHVARLAGLYVLTEADRPLVALVVPAMLATVVALVLAVLAGDVVTVEQE